jgi:hypothetical protein
VGLVDRPLYTPPFSELPADAAFFCGGGQRPCLHDGAGHDWATAERSYLAGSSADSGYAGHIGPGRVPGGVLGDNGVVVVDDFLSPDSFEAMRRLGEDFTLFGDARVGYIGAYMRNGLMDPTFLGVADELRQKMPQVFCGHGLEQAWAYKYDQRTQDMYAGASGISMHADLATINVNFWVGEPQKKGSEQGGMVVHLRGAPLDWGFDLYNKPGPHVDKHLGKGTVNLAPNVTVAHRPNRMVLFDSNLFHETDMLNFKPGYKNRRINFTLLFGLRGGHKKHLGQHCEWFKQEL